MEKTLQKVETSDIRKCPSKDVNEVLPWSFNYDYVTEDWDDDYTCTLETLVSQQIWNVSSK